MKYIIIIILILAHFFHMLDVKRERNNGYGTYIWFNGDTDTRSWSHGDKYIGYFKDGKMHSWYLSLC